MPSPKLAIAVDIMEKANTSLDVKATALVQSVSHAMLEVNKALPTEYKIRGTTDRNEATILVKYATSSELLILCKNHTLSCANSIVNTDDNTTTYTTISVAADVKITNMVALRTIILHELLHALGVQGHVSSKTFPKSIMGDVIVFADEFSISEIDRQVLESMYGTR